MRAIMEAEAFLPLVLLVWAAIADASVLSLTSSTLQLPPKRFPEPGDPDPGVQLRIGSDVPKVSLGGNQDISDTTTASFNSSRDEISTTNYTSVSQAASAIATLVTTDTVQELGLGSTLSYSTTPTPLSSPSSEMASSGSAVPDSSNPGATATSSGTAALSLTSTPASAATSQNVTFPSSNVSVTSVTSLSVSDRSVTRATTAQPFIEPSRSAAVLVGIFVCIAVIGYVGLMIWRRILEKKYGNREVLVNEEDFDVSDLKHFELQ